LVAKVPQHVRGHLAAGVAAGAADDVVDAADGQAPTAAGEEQRQRHLVVGEQEARAAPLGE
jgi:hypothetical protein